MQKISNGVGLVLSGGGAKGAYQVGVVRALAEMEIQVDAVSGASIGSLNAAMVSGSPNLTYAAEGMEAVWKALSGDDHPLKLDAIALSWKFGSALASVYGGDIGKLLVSTVAPQMPESGLCCSKHVLSLLQKYLPLDSLSTGLPFWVSVYPSDGFKTDMLNIAKAILGGDTKESEFLHINKMANADSRVRALLASAAIPLAFPRQKIDGKLYVDGGIGGWKKSSGNTPIQPLLDFGCNHVLVTHLSDGSLWSRHDFPNATILDIRPEGIERSIGDLLDFSGSSIDAWIKQGYRDTLRCVEPIRRALQLRQASQKAKIQSNVALARLQNDGFEIV